MIIQISENRRIHKIDELNWAIESRSIVSDTGKGKKPKPENIGQERWKADYYFQDLAQASTRLAKLLADESNDPTAVITLEEYAEEFRRISRQLAAEVRAVIGEGLVNA